MSHTGGRTRTEDNGKQGDVEENKSKVKVSRDRPKLP